jgi:hypothetical protein
LDAAFKKAQEQVKGFYYIRDTSADTYTIGAHDLKTLINGVNAIIGNQNIQKISVSNYVEERRR